MIDMLADRSNIKEALSRHTSTVETEGFFVSALHKREEFQGLTSIH